jgi:hypothetical protein
MGGGGRTWRRRWISVVPMLFAVACTTGQPSRANEPVVLSNPVIRAWELPLKDATTVAAVSGVVRITRKGDILSPSVGEPVKGGDLLQITPNSSLTLKSSRGVITLTSKDGEWFKFVQHN